MENLSKESQILYTVLVERFYNGDFYKQNGEIIINLDRNYNIIFNELLQIGFIKTIWYQKNIYSISINPLSIVANHCIKNLNYTKGNIATSKL